MFLLAEQADSLLSEPPGKPSNTGVGSLFLLQRIFPTQELNQGLLHCRWILYQLTYEGSPYIAHSRHIIHTADTHWVGSNEIKSLRLQGTCTSYFIYLR